MSVNIGIVKKLVQEVIKDNVSPVKYYVREKETNDLYEVTVAKIHSKESYGLESLLESTSYTYATRGYGEKCECCNGSGKK